MDLIKNDAKKIKDLTIQPNDFSSNNNDDDNKTSYSDPLNPDKNDIWKPEHNTILSEWADKAMCYRWLHFRSFMIYNRLNISFTVPVIIISTLTGTANFAAKQFTWEYLSLVIGGFNIFAGIVSTIQHFLKISELNEAHRVASLSWDKFYRNIKLELSKNPDDRISVHNMLKIYKEEFDRLMETCPIIEQKVINAFNLEFKNDPNFENVKKPEICSSLISTSESVYKIPVLDKNNIVINIDDTPKKKIIDQLKTENLVLKMKNFNVIKEKNRKIVFDFKNEFEKIHNREPLDEEVINNLKDKLDEETIKSFL
jgi:hypothetical protein